MLWLDSFASVLRRAAQQFADDVSGTFESYTSLTKNEHEDRAAEFRVTFFPHLPESAGSEQLEVVVREVQPAGYEPPDVRYWKALVEQAVERFDLGEGSSARSSWGQRGDDWLRSAKAALKEERGRRREFETRGEALERAALLAEKFSETGGLVYFHDADSEGPRWAILSPGRLLRLYERTFPRGEIPEGDREWAHEHVTRGEVDAVQQTL